MTGRTSTLFIVAAAAAFVAGCGTQKSAKSDAPKEAPFSQRLRSLSAAWRNATLIRAINDSGQVCDRINASAFQQTYKGLGMWHARCHDGGNWAIFIGDKGNAQVAPCSTDVGNPVPACLPIPAGVEAARRASSQGV
jgi:hypothetical protein